jgi:hypothetical protein
MTRQLSRGGERDRAAHAWLRRAVALIAGGAMACGQGGAQAAREQRWSLDTTGVVPAAVSTIPVRGRPELRENSGVVASLSQPGVIFMINDSGNEPVLFALDTTAIDRGAWRITGARNDDWEAAALGPCARPREYCIYIGDVGDNAASRSLRTLYRVHEPRASASGVWDSLVPERLNFRYQDGPHDVEAMYVGSDGTTWLITKRRLRGPTGPRPALVFAVEASAWSRAEGVAVAALVDSLPVVPGSGVGRLITDAARSPDGRHVAVRTYTEVFTFAADSVTGRLRLSQPPAVCDVAGLDERQGEGITWLRAGGPLLLTSEGNESPLRLVSCPLPDAPAG